MYYSPKTSTDGLVFHYDTGNTVRSYLGEPTTNLLPNGVAAVHDAASGNAVTVTDATTEKGPGWKKVTITARGSNFRTLQWTYLSMSANVTYTFSAVFDWGNMRGKNYFIYFDGNGTGARTYYRPGDYTNAGSELIDSTMPDGKFAGKILHSGTHTHSFFIGNSTTGVSGLNDYFYYKEFQAEAKSHPTQFTTGTRSATQGLKDLAAKNTINISTVSFDSNAQMTFDGTNDYISIPDSSVMKPSTEMTVEMIVKANSTTSGWNRLFGKDPYTNSWLIFLETGGTLIRALHYVGGTEYRCNTSYSISTTKYTHIVFTFKTGDAIRSYFNGSAGDGIVSLPAGTFQYNGTSDFLIGYAGADYFNGQIPVAKIYNQALTADQVQRNFNAVKSRFNIA
jgi:hypothetical protein